MSSSSSPNLAQASSPRRGVIAALATLLVITTIITYLPALNADYIWDDDDYVTNNKLLLDMEGLQFIWVPESLEITHRAPRRTPQYYPVVFTSFWIEYQLWELNPRGYHLINVLLHACSALLLWRILTLLKIPGKWIGAGLIAGIFALHPVQVESVAWITERKNILSGLLYLGAMLAYLRFESERDDAQSAEENRGVWGWYGLAFVLFACALLSKSVTCSLPAALILVMLYQRKTLNIKRLLPLVPMFIFGFLIAMNTAGLEKEHVGAVGVDFDHTFIERCLIASKALLFYPIKILWPHPIIFIYPRWEIDATNWLSYWAPGLVLFIAASLLLHYFRGRRGPFLALAFFAGTVFPAIGFFNVYPHLFSFVADHFQYLAFIGVTVFVVSSAYSLIPNRPRLVTYVGLAVLPILAALSFSHSSIYQNEETLWRATIEKNPQSWMSYNNLGKIMLQRNLLKESETFLQQCLALRPEHFNAQSNLAEVLRRQGRLDEALNAITTALATGKALYEDERRPSLVFLAKEYHQLGLIHAGLGQAAEAESAYRTSLELAPDRPPVNFSYAVLLLDAERFDDSARHFRIYLDKWNPEDMVALDAMGMISEHQERYDLALQYYQKSFESARTGLDQLQAVSTLIRFLSSCPDLAIRDQNRAINLAESMNRATQGQNSSVLDLLGAAYAQADRFKEAIAAMQSALQLARAAGQYDQAAEMKSHLEKYQNGETLWP